MKPGARIPSEMQLARELGMNNRTIRRGLAQLVDEGVIVKQAGAGSFVKPTDHLHATTSTALMLPEHLSHVERFSATGLVYDGVRRALDQSRFGITMFTFTQGRLWEEAGAGGGEAQRAAAHS